MIIGHQHEEELFTRLIKENRLSGSFLFFGEAEIGKFTFAKNIAEKLEEGQNTLTEALIISPDEKDSIGIDRIRELKSFLSEKPVNAKLRTVIIDDAQLLTLQAENALLKISEEPPRQALIILITANPESLLPTLVSRFQKIYFERVNKNEIKNWLVKEHNVVEKIAVGLAEKSFGKPGLALEMLKGEKISTDNLETEKDYVAFIKQEIISLHKDKIKNVDKLKNLLKRLSVIKQYNTNKKIQLQSALWTR